MNISGQVWNNVVQINLDGRFDAATAPAAEQYIRDCIARGFVNVVINMTSVQYIASAGLRVVLAMTKELRLTHHGDLRVAALPVPVAKVFELSGLYGVIRIFDDVPTATQSFLG
jgi:anti-anti-sigma factor